jgi:hypothetical protein
MEEDDIRLDKDLLLERSIKASNKERFAWMFIVVCLCLVLWLVVVREWAVEKEHNKMVAVCNQYRENCTQLLTKVKCPQQQAAMMEEQELERLLGEIESISGGENRT